MHDPKSFYRELDALLAKIGEDKSGKNNLDSIFIELEQKFGDRLYIHDGCIYEQRDKDFILIFNAGHDRWQQKMPLESEAVQRVLQHGSFIFDETAIRGDFILTNGSGNIVPAAISINSPERQWLFVFGLKDGWIREEIHFFLMPFVRLSIIVFFQK